MSVSFASLAGTLGLHAPLKIVWSRILMLSFGTEWADVAGRLMDEAMTYHFVFPLEAFATFRTWAALYRAVVRSNLAVYICVRTT